MDPNKITLESISKLFEYEKLSRDIDSIDDNETLKNYAKAYIKLYLSQQEVISNLGL
jgi:hypothetical protein